jgi:hypothetical protein
MDPFERLVKPTDAFSEKCTKMHKIKYINIQSLSLCFDLYYRSYYSVNQLCLNTVFEILKNYTCNMICASLSIH